MDNFHEAFVEKEDSAVGEGDEELVNELVYLEVN